MVKKILASEKMNYCYPHDLEESPLLRYDSLADLWPMLDAAIAKTGSGTTLEIDEKAGQDIT